VNPGPVVSYSDERYAPSGNLYEILGFTQQGLNRPDYRYWRDGRWYAKNSKQKKYLHREAEEAGIAFNDEHTEFELARILGYKRCYDLGKITWLLT